MSARWLLGLPVLGAAACLFPDVSIDADAGSGGNPASSSTDTATSIASSSSGAGGASSTTTSSSSSSSGDGGSAAAQGGGGSSSEGGGGSAGVTGSGGGGGGTTGSNGGGGSGGVACSDGCELAYPWDALGCDGYEGGDDCPAFTYQGASAPSCGDSTQRQACVSRSTVLGAECVDEGNPTSTIAQCTR